MYGLKQAAILAHNHLIEKLKPFGYRPIPNTMGLWEHESRPTKFCLCVDDFGVKSFHKNDTNHLLDALQTSYNISTDMTGENYCGLTMNWNYTAGHVDISMPGYIEKVLHKYPLPSKKFPQYAPYKWTTPKFGAKRQFAKLRDTSPLLPPPLQRKVQQIVGSLLYYSRAVDPTMLVALNEIAANQAAYQLKQHLSNVVCSLIMRELIKM